MERIFGTLMATGWLALISALWLGGIGLSALFLLQHLFAFNPLTPASWQMLMAGFRQGQAIPLGFILLCLTLAALGLIGEMAILWRLPAIIARLPSFSLPHLSFRLPKLPARTPRARKPASPAPPPVTAPPPPSPSPPQAAPPPEPAAEQAPGTSDSTILSRILALFEVWNEPPPSWMAEALQDEILLLSPEAWPTLETLGSHGLDLLVTLQEHGMLPDSPAALRAIGEVEATLRAGLAAEAARPETAAPVAMLTLPASWLCEALENFLAAQEDNRSPPEQRMMAQTMLEQAMRGMGDVDWASLDLFPEKASRVRVLTDQLREDMRKAGPPKPAAPVIERTETAAPAPASMQAAVRTPIETILALLERLGFTLEGGQGLLGSPLLAQRPDLLLFLQAIDLGQKSWRMPEGLLGSWFSHEEDVMSPGRQLWQLLARRRLRHTDSRPLAGLLVLHRGKVEQEEALAELVVADRRRCAIGLAWLDDLNAPLPALERELHDLTERAVREHSLQRSESYSAAQP